MIFKKIFNFIYYILGIHMVMLLTSVLPNIKQSNQFRGFLLRPFFKKAGKNFQVAKGVIFNQSRRISIGDNVYIAHNCWLNGTGELTIESNVIVSPMVVITTTKHKYINGKVSNTQSEYGSVVIGNGSWIASNSVITKGVNIGKGAIVGACSSVNKDVSDYTFAGGVPAKEIKKIN